MLKISRMTDYATRILAELLSEKQPISAVDLAEKTHLPLPTVSKLLKRLAQANILCSYRGSHGGYILKEEKQNIRLIDVLDAIDGPVAMTSCASKEGCLHQNGCVTQTGWVKVNALVVNLLSKMYVSDLLRNDSLPELELLWSKPEKPKGMNCE